MRTFSSYGARRLASHRTGIGIGIGIEPVADSIRRHKTKDDLSIILLKGGVGAMKERALLWGSSTLLF